MRISQATNWKKQMNIKQCFGLKQSILMSSTPIPLFLAHYLLFKFGKIDLFLLTARVPSSQLHC